MFSKHSTTTRRLALCAAPLVLVWSLSTGPARAQSQAAPDQMQSQTAGEQSFSQAQIEQAVAPIALYPDSLLTQILMASTYPLEVVEAARWSHANPAVKGQALENAKGQSWDPSVKALTAVPQTLQMMSDKLAWTEELGDAFLAQQQDVLAAVQELRAEAQATGNLKSTPQQVVSTASQAGGVSRPIVIEPVNPDVYYVPVYNPELAFGAWQYPAYQPFYWSPPGFVASNVVSFAAGVAVGAAIWGGCNWWNHNVIINVNRYNVFNRTDINVTNNVWVHNPAHRGNVPYRNAAVAARFGRGNEVAARDALIDRVDVERNDMIRDRAAIPANTEHNDAPRDHVDAGHFDAPSRPEDRAADDATRIAPDRERRDDGGNAMRPRMPAFHSEGRVDAGFHPHLALRRR